jgi:hypothetical protein
MIHRSRFALVSVLALLGSAVCAVAPASPAVGAATGKGPMCEVHPFLCTDTHRHKNYEGRYTGHDEPAVAFYSNTPGSGSRSNYTLTLPRDSAMAPKQDGTGGTWHFQLHPAFWFGMDLCDNQSAPEFTHAPCKPNSDSNIFDNPDPRAPKWIGHHPGTAFMEMQFYPPGWTAWPAGVSCTATQWCAALNVDSLTLNDLTGQQNNADCLNKVGDEPVNFAFITKTGRAHAPAGPLDNAVNSARTFNPSTDFLMNPGDRINVDIRDTSAGLQIILADTTRGTTGYMTASTANGFSQVVFDPGASTCYQLPYAFRPQYSTSTPHTRPEWTAHALNVSMSDEIGHFEYCTHVSSAANCTDKSTPTDPGGSDRDDNACFKASESLLVKIGGCITDFDDDFDGPAYHLDWPGNRADPLKTAEPVRFTSPTFDGHQYNRVAFESDLVNLERAFGYCTSDTLSDCHVPPTGSAFYPMYTTGTSATGGCEWREGGPNLPQTINSFGGTPASQWGRPIATFYPTGPRSTTVFYENFYRSLPNNPCLR